MTKPARYLGGEYLSVTKDPATVDARVCLAFPDVYDIGMSHLGTKILYSLLNKDPRIAAERAFTPWLDMEEELRARRLPLVSLESQTRLAEFDVVGFSLQYEMTFTNVLTMLDLGGIPLRAADRAPDSPLVLAGGPTASHPEPMAPFFDATFLGEAEEVLPALVKAWAALRRRIGAPGADGLDRREALIQLAAAFPVYVPSLYATEVDADTGMTVVGAPLDPRVPARVRRAVVLDLDKYPFPSDTPVPYAEAVFERASVEIARGCTEGCRFCQAGMIYRPVRERSPASIMATVIEGVDKAGYDETGLTCLSTADFSSITPLVKTLGNELRQRGVSMSVASLRAYGLGEDILDEMAQTRISGLTFAPEAGTQRMRDVVNKNVTEAHIEESARRVFERGWHRLKLYFMIGLPTEEDDDVRGIVETGARMLKVGAKLTGGRAEVTVSVSSHVPKPHTPFQWAAQDAIEEIQRKQSLLKATIPSWARALRVKYHDRGISFVEGVLARGDRRLADVIEEVWRRGGRFDSWDEVFDVERWREVFAARGVDTDAYLGTRPISARLPWDHLDVGLEDGFLLQEYRKALKSRLSPPCGKVAGMLVHHTNVRDAEADARKLVCYDCGVACDLSGMRAERLVALRALGAAEPVVRPADAVPRRSERVRKAGFIDAVELPWTSYRIRYAKVGRVAFLGHLDMGRLLMRIFRRAELPLAMSRGYSPKPRMTFGPALGLGVASLGEVFDCDIEHAPGGQAGPGWAHPCAGEPLAELSPEVVLERLRAVSPEGVHILDCEIVPRGTPGLGKRVVAWDLLIQPAADGIAHDAARLERIAAALRARDTVPVVRGANAEKQVDLRPLLEDIAVVAGDEATRLCAALDWPDQPLLRVRVKTSNEGSAKPIEIAQALGVWGDVDPRAPHALLARLGLVMISADEVIAARATAAAARSTASAPAPRSPTA
ncbi:MAG: TIGR03960 family B12-binding radical SAM protein [Myxococcales bacterium]|nr:TIGR03960 family B12-binding radical SAM protein [Myxococcales bacterium]